MTSMAGAMDIRPVQMSELTELHALIERAYRGESAKAGWTHEADMLFDDRIEISELENIMADPASCMLVAHGEDEAESIIGCVHIKRLEPGKAYLGLLCISPPLQANGLGRRLIAAAEQAANAHFGAREMVMQVIESRHELIAYYQRRGYRATGRRLDFPIPLAPPLFMTELAKDLTERA